jgi:DNA repair protein RadD
MLVYKMILRDYQIRTLDETWTAMQVKHNILITAPCSAGKTIIFSKIIQRLLRENSSFRALILVDREILVSQSADKLRSVAPELGLSIGIVCASVSARKDFGLPVTVASRQSLINRLGEFPPVQLVIVDEAHLMACPTMEKPAPDQYAAIISKLREYNPHMRLLGCTASPYRLGAGYIYGDRNKPGTMPYFETVDSTITTMELLAGGYIAPLTGMAAVNTQYAEDLTNVNMVAGEYNLGQLSDMMCKAVHLQSCVDAWEKYADGRKKGLVFCTSIEHSEKVAETFRNNGITACAIHSKLSPIELSVRMQELKTGGMQVFTSVAKLTTGFDVPDIDCIVMARPTKSTALYQQAIGRGQRLSPDKTNCLVIDLTGCTTDFGTDMDNLRVQIPYGDGGGEAPKKICPGENGDGSVCGQSVHASLRYCPHCNFSFPVTELMESALGTMKKVEFNKLPEPEEWDVTSVSYSVHFSKKTEKDLIKVTYECGQFNKFYEWVCLPDFYEGYAVTKAQAWWQERCDEPFPATCEEFIFLSEELITPGKIMVLRQPKQMDKVVKCLFAETGDYPVFTEKEIESSDFSDEIPF